MVIIQSIKGQSPLYLTSAFGATPALKGIIEGISESFASLLKVFSGMSKINIIKKSRLLFWDMQTDLFTK